MAVVNVVDVTTARFSSMDDLDVVTIGKVISSKLVEVRSAAAKCVKEEAVDVTSVKGEQEGQQNLKY